MMKKLLIIRITHRLYELDYYTLLAVYRVIKKISYHSNRSGGKSMKIENDSKKNEELKDKIIHRLLSISETRTLIILYELIIRL